MRIFYFLAGWFTTFFKDSVDPEDNFDSRPGANLFIKHVKYEAPSESTEAASVTTNEQTTPKLAEEDNKQTDTESIPFNNIFTRKESENEFVDRKQVDAEEEALKQLYERGDGGAADGEEITVATRAESTQAAESPSNQPNCFSKITNHKEARIIYVIFTNMNPGGTSKTICIKWNYSLPFITPSFHNLLYISYGESNGTPLLCSTNFVPNLSTALRTGLGGPNDI